MPAKKKSSPSRKRPKATEQLVNTPYGEMTPAEIEEFLAQEDATEAKLRRELGDEVVDPLDTIHRLRGYRLSYAEGNVLALMFAVRLCAEGKAHLPRWAIKALADGFSEYLDAPLGTPKAQCSLDKIFLRTKRGKRDPKTSEFERWRSHLLYCATQAALDMGCVGPRAFECAADVIWWKFSEEIRLAYWGNLTPQTAKAVYKSFKPRKSEPTGSTLMYCGRLIREWKRLPESERARIAGRRKS